MKHIPAALVVSFLTLSGTEALAVPGNVLMPMCNSDAGLAYVTGVNDTLIVTRKDGALCIPDKVTNGQMRDIVCQYLRDNPKTRHKNASVLTYEALREAFPCKR